MNKWLDFERLIARIYESISPQATVLHDDKIRSHDGKRVRQIDVSIRFREAGCDFLIVVQAKTNVRPLDINAIGEFKSVVEDVRATKGVLICNSGFTKNAQEYAQDHGIDLCTAHDAENKDWRTVLKLPVVWIRLSTFIRCEMILELNGADSVSAELLEWRFSTRDSEKGFSLWNKFTEKWNSHALPMEPDKTHKFEISHDGLQFLAGDVWRPICEFDFTYRVERVALLNELETEEFTGIRNLLTDNLEFAHLGVSIPPRLPKYGWTETDIEEEQSIAMKPTIVTVEAPRAIQYSITDPVETTTLADNVGMLDANSNTMKIKRGGRYRVVFQTIDPFKRKIELTEIR
ncbi:MAG: restriction endonuclease [Gimesia chilikensis]|uniref:restriction endonuclease n=1 Tax=Gimesia chilikensis TaxID=2605989 RepID=UPI0037B2214B